MILYILVRLDTRTCVTRPKQRYSMHSWRLCRYARNGRSREKARAGHGGLFVSPSQIQFAKHSVLGCINFTADPCQNTNFSLSFEDFISEYSFFPPFLSNLDSPRPIPSPLPPPPPPRYNLRLFQQIRFIRTRH